mmetsp:Transcript_18053/g.50506  ORF Transcript_18053/g.50506 Transcript_18053/m.50506 type:complete len:579 (-) Transcript_18053:576-2312(-)
MAADLQPQAQTPGRYSPGSSPQYCVPQGGSPRYAPVSGFRNNVSSPILVSPIQPQPWNQLPYQQLLPPSNSSSPGLQQQQPLPRTSSRAGMDRSLVATQAQAHPRLFGAIAELVDNSRDQAATRVKIWVEADQCLPVLFVKDNGKGMSHQGIRRMLSMGHAPDRYDKDKLGKYGVGFKSGSMAIGKTALVLTSDGDTYSMGLLSQVLKPRDPEDRTLHTRTVTFKRREVEFDLSVQTEAEAEAAMEDITTVTGLSKNHLLAKLGMIKKTGTLICIMDLSPNSEAATDHVSGSTLHLYELLWTKDNILLANGQKKQRPGNFAVSQPIDWDLMEYMAALYSRPPGREFEITIQGRTVPQWSLRNPSMLKKRSKIYERKFQKEGLAPNEADVATVEFAYSPELKNDSNCGVCIFWRDRMITVFDTMDMMSQKDFGIFGIASTGNFLNPTSNKQEFVNTPNFEEFKKWIKNCYHDYKENNFGDRIQEKADKHDIESTWANCNNRGLSGRLALGYSLSDDDAACSSGLNLMNTEGYGGFGCDDPQEPMAPSEIATAVYSVGRRVPTNTPSKKGQSGPKKQKIV